MLTFEGQQFVGANNIVEKLTVSYLNTKQKEEMLICLFSSLFLSKRSFIKSLLLMLNLVSLVAILSLFLLLVVSR